MNQESFTSLAKEHEHLNELFDGHQRGLLEGNVDLALSALATFGGELERHLEFEEHRVLPLYADLGAETPGGTLALFQAEHAKLREAVERLTRRTEELYGARDIKGAIVALLDDEAMFKGLFHHHVGREEKLLFPRLDERTTEEERRTWLNPSDENSGK